MTSRYFVVEGKPDEAILKTLLPQSLLQETKIITASGYSAALSVIQTLFTLTPLPISFFFDVDTYSDDKIQEKQRFIHSYLKKILGNKFLLFPFKPEIEILFFYKKFLLEQLLQTPISDELWSQAKYQPKQVLSELVNDKNYFSVIEKNLTVDIIKKLQQNPLILDIIKKHSDSTENQNQIITT